MGRRFTGACTIILALLAGVARADGGQSSRSPAAAVVAAIPYGANKVAAPTLILSSDHDLIRLGHTVDIYEALPDAELAVFPNSTHLVPYDDPTMFNATVERFLMTPFKRKNRIADTMASYEKLMAGVAK